MSERRIRIHKDSVGFIVHVPGQRTRLVNVSLKKNLLNQSSYNKWSHKVIAGRMYNNHIIIIIYT